MTKEKKADIEAALAELEHELHLAITQGAIPRMFQWQHVLTGADGKPWIAVLTVGRVDKDGEAV